VRELISVNEPVFLSWIVATLASEGIEAIVFDTNMSILEGSVSAIPRRVMVVEADYARARRILVESGELPADA
jgi:hypothetical protein